MEDVIGLLRIRVKKGKNLVVKDAASSDPFVTITMGDQTVKTNVVKNNCNPEWNDELTLSIKHLNVPIVLNVYDKDTFTKHDNMGEAEIMIAPYIECKKMGLKNVPNGTTVSRVQPDLKNCLASESSIVWINGKLVQHVCLRLKHVACGEVEIELEWIDLPGRKVF